MTRAMNRSLCNFRCFSYMSRHAFTLLLVVTAALSSRASSNPLPGPHFSSHNGPASSSLYDRKQTFTVWIAAATCATASVLASFVAFYWFCRMEKRFRHRLIMLLIYGDLTKAVWLSLFAVVSIAQGTVYTSSGFCQASGFLIQYGAETSDYAVLVMAIHSALQVFRPSTFAQGDGLYTVRHYVYAGGLFIPVLMAGLAFVNPNWAYMSQGAFCTLPFRPFWYRLALTWIPRYLIAIIILGLAVAIYAHVGFETRSFSQVSRNVKPSVSTTTPILSVQDAEGTTTEHGSPIPEARAWGERRGSSLVPDDSAIRHMSAAHSLGDLISTRHGSIERAGRSQSASAGARRASRISSTIHRQSDAPLSTCQSQKSNEDPIMPSSFSLPALNTQDLESRNHDSPRPSLLNEAEHSPIQRHLDHQRARIHRQLRLMFIYPLVYILMWLIPFIHHCMTYKDEWAAHPVYWLSLMATICVTLMGTVDSLIFSLRERPWRHMPNTDGTFFGSFVCWRRHPVERKRNSARPGEALQRAFTESGVDGRSSVSVIGPDVVRPSPGAFALLADVRQHSVRTGRSSDGQRAAAGMARVRLELEKEQRRLELRDNRSRDRWDDLYIIESPDDELEGTESGGTHGDERKGSVAAKWVAEQEKKGNE